MENINKEPDGSIVEEPTVEQDAVDMFNEIRHAQQNMKRLVAIKKYNTAGRV